MFHQILFSQVQQSPLIENCIFYNVTLAPGLIFSQLWLSLGF